ncbi:hypothetical protein OSB04_019792 [Centaurea solstitialis]|uniref:F-box domain-containing protein n=1 Tax=Centaurea solstitialis TaxID=347529 RepID=A0AA38WEL2_9ASTR|nr:hypothetical protein OSB04_019792 [Centaurea solstitialis]
MEIQIEMLRLYFPGARNFSSYETNCCLYPRNRAPQGIPVKEGPRASSISSCTDMHYQISDSSNAKQDRSINNKRGASRSEQMDVVHDDRESINEEEEDRISKLPDDIVHCILSFLDIRYAIQTSALSKKWKHVWTSMPHLNLNNRTFDTFPQFSKFVKHALSHRNHHREVYAVKLSFAGTTTKFATVMRRIVNYAYAHNVRHLTMIWSNSDGLYHRKFPQCCFSSLTLKHLTLAIDKICRYGGCVPIPSWDFPALETLNLRNMQLSDGRGTGDKSLTFFSKCVNLKHITLHKCSMNHLDVFNVCAPQLSYLTIEDPIDGGYKPNLAWDFQALETLKLSNMQLNYVSCHLLSNCVNLKDLTLHGCSMYDGMDAFNICAPQLSNLTITHPYVFPKVFNVVVPQLKNLTASVNTTTYRYHGINFLQLSTEGLNSLEKVNLHMSRSMHELEIYVPQLLNLFQKLYSAKFLILDLYIIQIRQGQ